MKTKEKQLSISGLTYIISDEEIKKMTKEEKKKCIKTLNTGFIYCPQNEEEINEVKKQLDLHRGLGTQFVLYLAQLELGYLYKRLMLSL